MHARCLLAGATVGMPDKIHTHEIMHTLLVYRGHFHSVQLSVAGMCPTAQPKVSSQSCYCRRSAG